MTIRAKLRLNSFVSVFLIIVFSVVTILLLFSLQRASQKQQLTQQITGASFQMALLQNEYILHPSERPKIQWINAYESLARFLEQGEPLFAREEERVQFERLRVVFDASRVLFGKLVQNIEGEGSAKVTEELSNQLTAKSQERVSSVSSLSDFGRADTKRALNIFELLTSILVLLIISIALWSYAISRSIAESLRMLNEGTKTIASGNLDYRLEVKSDNEIGLLARSFNKMTEKLQDLYSHMEEKVKEKTEELSKQVVEVDKSKSAILNLLEDIEEEKNKAEAMVVERTHELSEEKARLLASINSLSFGFVLADLDDRILLKNPRLERILEYKTEPHSIHDIAELLKATDSKVNIDIASSCRRCMELKEPVEFKEVSYGKKFLRIICAPIISEKGTIGYIFVVEDITEAKVMERSRDEFFAVASHELRTPLTAIRGNADMILSMYADKIADKDMKEMLVDINTSSVRLIDIVNDFLEVSRLEQGKIDFKKENFDVLEIVNKVTRDLKEMISKKGLALLFTPPTTLLKPVFADKNRVEQILINLVDNSAKFTREGSITIDIASDAKFLKISVSDTGLGISKHNQARLFRKFQQAGEDMLARDVTQSTGLGLYISHLLIEGMGGEIKLEKSELGKGSTFSFTVPTAS